MPSIMPLAVLAAIVTLNASTSGAFAGPDWSRAQLVRVVAADYRFSPNKLTFRHGAVFRLHLENRGKETHEFHAAEFFKTAQLRDPAILNADRDEIVLQPGDKKDAYFVAPPPGHYRLYCPDHDWAGMTGTITVK